MIGEQDLEDVKKIIEEILQKLQADYFTISTKPVESSPGPGDVVGVDIKLREPQMLIGQGGQSLFSLQRIAGIIVGRRLKKNIYLQLDINDYKKEKISYLKNLARQSADEVALTKKPKELPSMSSYERRIIHTELAHRTDVGTESRGDNEERRIVIIPR